MRKFGKVVAVIGSAALLVLGLNLLTPLAYHGLPNDYVRTRLILGALQRERPELVVLGNSRGMSGLNANMLEDSLGLPALNCCSVSQHLAESMLYYDRLPASVKVVLQCIDEKEFTRDAVWLNKAAITAFSMNVYRPDSLPRALLGQSDLNRLTESRLRRNFRARNAFKTGVAKWLIKHLDDDAPSDGLYDMKYPYIYPSDHSKTYDRDLQLQREFLPDETTVFELPASLRNYCATLDRYLAQRGVTLVFVLMPNCPALGWPREAYASYRRAVTATLGNCRWIDALEALPDEGFYDPLHPNRIGGALLTPFVAAQLRAILSSDR